MNKNLFIVAILAVSVSCRTTRPDAPPPKIIVKDSLVERTTIIYRDTTITKAGETVKLLVPIPCPDSVKPQQIKQGNTSLKVYSEPEGLLITCETDSLKLVIDSLREVVNEKQSFQTKETIHTVYQDKIVKRTPKWVWYLLVANILYVAWRFRKPISKLLGL